MDHSAAPPDPAPFYDAHLFVCCNRRAEGHPRGSCAASGSEALRDYMKRKAKQMGLKKVRVNQAGCLDRCELGPVVVVYPEGVWYRILEPEVDIEEIVVSHFVGGKVVDRLRLAGRVTEPTV